MTRDKQMINANTHKNVTESGHTQKEPLSSYANGFLPGGTVFSVQRRMRVL